MARTGVRMGDPRDPIATVWLQNDSGDDRGRGFRGWPPRRGGSGSRKEIPACAGMT